MTTTLDTKNGVLYYNIIVTDNGYKGEIKHDLYKHPKFKGKVLTRHSKVFKTIRGAKSWLGKQQTLQRERLQV